MSSAIEKRVVDVLAGICAAAIASFDRFFTEPFDDGVGFCSGSFAVSGRAAPFARGGTCIGAGVSVMGA